MKKFLIFFRIVIFLLLLVLAFRPVLDRPQAFSLQNWALLIDSSKSMRTSDPEPRIKKAIAVLNSLLTTSSHLTLFQFSKSAEELRPDGIMNLKADGEQSNLARSLKSVLDQSSYQGAVVLTDGRQVGGEDVLGVASALGKPLFIVGFGDKNLFRDVSVQSVQAPPFTFKNISTSISATVSAMGYQGRPLIVRLRQGNNILSLQTIPITSLEFETTLTFPWVPSSLGLKSLKVEVVPMEGEITTVNNQKTLNVDVGRDRFRVLYICGEPGPEYGFLRYQFKSDPSVELVTFVILRNNQNVLSVPENELSLIPFPTQDVLINQLATFDLIVFEEFTYTQFGLSPALMFGVRQRVKDGGSFLLMGSSRVFGEGSPYALAELQEMFPVPMGGTVTASTKKFKLQVKGGSHPILRLETHEENNRNIWSHLPEIDDVSLLSPAKPEATVLLTAQEAGRIHPVLTVGRYGKGRVATLSARTTWRWAMQKGESQSSIDVYQKFWKNMVIWLTHSEEYQSVRIVMDKKEIVRSDKTDIRIWVYDDYFRPVSDADIFPRMKRPGGTFEPVEVREQSPGVYSIFYVPDALGVHEVTVSASRKGQRVGESSLKFSVVEGVLEEEDLRPDFEILNELADVTHGRFFKGDEFNTHLFKEFSASQAKKSGKKIVLWNSPYLLIFLLFLIIGEWVIRRKQGLL